MNIFSFPVLPNSQNEFLISMLSLSFAGGHSIRSSIQTFESSDKSTVEVGQGNLKLIFSSDKSKPINYINNKSLVHNKWLENSFSLDAYISLLVSVQIRNFLLINWGYCWHIFEDPKKKGNILFSLFLQDSISTLHLDYLPCEVRSLNFSFFFWSLKICQRLLLMLLLILLPELIYSHIKLCG